MAFLIEKKHIPQTIERFESYLKRGFSPEDLAKLMTNEELVLVALYFKYKNLTEPVLQSADLVEYEEVELA